MDLPFYREYELPWTSSAGQEEKFKRLLWTVLGVAFALRLANLGIMHNGQAMGVVGVKATAGGACLGERAAEKLNEMTSVTGFLIYA